MVPAPLFDTYVMVDWSAAEKPARGADSIWIAVLRRRGENIEIVLQENTATRADARAVLRGLFIAGKERGERLLAGFDFAFAYPAGFAKHLELNGTPWRAVWSEISHLIQDDDTNHNNRFDVASDINRRLTGDAYPFWGHPPGRRFPFLQPKHHRKHRDDEFSERRLVEHRMRGPQPVWKLSYAGSVGSQTLTGIPVLHALRNDPALFGSIRVWPFETGLVAPPSESGPLILLAEIYPSMVPVHLRGDEVKDRAQVRSLAQYFARRDIAGRLAQLFAGDRTLSVEDRQRVEQEEGWVLGVEDTLVQRAPSGLARTSARESRKKELASDGLLAKPRYRYLKNPAAIYRRSFALIRREADFSAVPEELHPLALRLVHACGDPALVDGIRASPEAVTLGQAALKAGAAILVDTQMVAVGIMKHLLSRKAKIRCTLGDRRVAALARRLGTTRSAAAVELWRPHLEDAVVAIGNAPTALFRLLELIAAGAPKPALVLGFPVGFVGAAESKAALVANPFGLAYVTLLGRRGGSALAAAAVNALAGAPG